MRNRKRLRLAGGRPRRTKTTTRPSTCPWLGMWSTAGDGLHGWPCWRFQSGGIEMNSQVGVPDAIHEEVSTAETLCNATRRSGA